MTNFLISRNSRDLVIASEAKQSLGILDFLGVRGCLFFGILDNLASREF